MTSVKTEIRTRRAGPNESHDPALERFAQALRQAMVLNGWSERRLGGELGITIGTTQKYFRGKVHPMNVATRINRLLARHLGVSLDGLVAFYEGGPLESTLTFEQVVTWVRSNAGSEHLGSLVCAMSEAAKRENLPAAAVPKNTEPYTWPEQELDDAGISQRLRERMGLGQEVMRKLREKGEFDDALVEAFSVAVNLEEDAVREAFKARQPVVG